ncbi:hypothetical protein [Ensifer canadensis]|uniref:DUF7940 domain-containing protein n=1 Tax=Ensifer canadensis TaxID=555315 RepID=UPI0035E3F0C2
MSPIPNWRLVLRYAWSIRLMLLAALLSGTEVALPFFEYSIPAGIFAALSALTTAAALVARFVAQAPLAPNQGDKNE